MIDNMISVEKSKLQDYMTTVFTKVGVDPEVAEISANHLVYADVRGIDTHGVLRFPIYIKRIQQGLINNNPNCRFENETDNTIILDGDNGPGQYSAHLAMEKAMEKAKDNTIGMVFVKGGNHFGAAGTYTDMAAKEGLIGFTTTNTGPLMAPTGGADRILGNNPLSFAVPRKDADPIILDMACSQVAAGKLMLAAQKGETIPENWSVDKEGKPTTNPHAGYGGGGSLLPVGFHKGYGLAFIMDILAGVMSGSAYGKHVQSLYDLNTTEPLDLGFMMMAINIESILPKEYFYTRIEDYASMISNSRPAVGKEKIYLPGEIENEEMAKRLKTGIPLNPNLFGQLRDISEELDISFDL